MHSRNLTLIYFFIISQKFHQVNGQLEYSSKRCYDKSKGGMIYELCKL